MLVQSGRFSAQDTVKGIFSLSSIIEYRNRTILATLNLHVPQCLPSSSSSIRLTLWEMSFEEFQNGHDSSDLGYQNAWILVILNLYVALMLPIIFQLSQTLSSGGNVP